jgi:hypothetical protein
MLVTSIEFGHQGEKENRTSWEQVANEVQQFDWYGHDADDGNVCLPYGEDGGGQGDAVEKSAQFDWRNRHSLLSKRRISSTPVSSSVSYPRLPPKYLM